jgi:RNA polymerase-associated protein RTF1
MEEDGDDDEEEEENEEVEESEPDERKEKKKAEIEVDDSPEGTYQDYLKLQLRRYYITKWLSEPFFEEAILHTFVRVWSESKNGIDAYVMAEIVSVKDGFRTYKADNKLTDIRLDLAVGESIRRFRISEISNSRISELEFSKYCERVRYFKNGKLLTVKVLYLFNKLLYNFHFEKYYIGVGKT